MDVQKKGKRKSEKGIKDGRAEGRKMMSEGEGG
jgi:hypothetical protein